MVKIFKLCRTKPFGLNLFICRQIYTVIYKIAILHKTDIWIKLKAKLIENSLHCIQDVGTRYGNINYSGIYWCALMKNILCDISFFDKPY